MRKPSYYGTILAPLLAVAMPFGGASAAPQMLGLVASNSPVPLNCVGGTCTGQFTAFCLEQDREVPHSGTPYRAVDIGRMTLVLTGANGRTIELPAGDRLTYSAGRGYSNVNISLNVNSIAGYEYTKVALFVGRNVSLVPVAQAGDKTAHTPAEIAHKSGPMRKLGSRVVDGAGPKANAARTLNKMLNSLPPAGRMKPGERATAWERTIGPKPGMTAMTGATIARSRYDICQRKVAEGRFFSLRSCLETQHDSIMSRLNKRYWDSAHPGM